MSTGGASFWRSMTNFKIQRKPFQVRSHVKALREVQNVRAHRLQALHSIGIVQWRLL